MVIFNKISVGIDLTPFDETILKYLGLFIGDIEAKEIELLHVQKKQDIPSRLSAKFPELIDQLIPEKLLEEYKHLTDKYLPGKKIRCSILDGKPLHQLNDYFQENKVDLFVTCNKNPEHRKSISPQKIARKCASNILMVPENSPIEINKVLVPLDFSCQSKISLLYALELAKGTDIEVSCYHCYDIPIGYTKTGISHEEFSSIMKKNAEEDWEEFKKGIHFHNLKFNAIFEEAEGHHGNQIYAHAVKHNHDMILIGSHGRTNLAALFLGSTTEELIQYDRSVPILIVKDREKVLNAWEALKQL